MASKFRFEGSGFWSLGHYHLEIAPVEPGRKLFDGTRADDKTLPNVDDTGTELFNYWYFYSIVFAGVPLGSCSS